MEKKERSTSRIEVVVMSPPSGARRGRQVPSLEAQDYFTLLTDTIESKNTDTR